MALELGLSAGAIVATAGMGGDVIVKLVFTVIDVITMINWLIDLILRITDPNLMRLLMEIFNINFNGGPFDVRCWVDFVYNTYAGDPVMMGGFDTMCTFYGDIRDQISEYIGKIIGGLIPNAPRALVGILTQKIVEMSQHKLFKFIWKKYKEVDKDLRMILENVQVLDQSIAAAFLYIDDFITHLPANLDDLIAGAIGTAGSFSPIPFSGLTAKIAGKVVGSVVSTATSITGLDQLKTAPPGMHEFFQSMAQNSTNIALAISKMLAFIFSLLYILKLCGEM